MSNFKKVYLYLQRCLMATYIFRKQQCFSLPKNLDNSLRTGESLRLLSLKSVYDSIPTVEWSSIYPSRRELIFNLCTQVVQNLLAERKSRSRLLCIHKFD